MVVDLVVPPDINAQIELKEICEASINRFLYFFLRLYIYCIVLSELIRLCLLPPELKNLIRTLLTL